MKDSQSKIHPGSGRRKALEFNKGRQSDDQSIDDLKNLIPVSYTHLTLPTNSRV